MPDILQDFPIQAPPQQVFEAIATPAGLDAWWTLRCTGRPARGEIYEFDFGPGYVWRGRVIACEAGRCLEWEMVEADADWTGSRVRFELEATARGTQLRFSHHGWPGANAHFRTSGYCWAMYLRLLKRYVERGEIVPYGARLEA